MDKNRGILFSLVLHLLLLIAALSLRSANILIPSQSNGMEVELVAPNEIVHVRTPEKPHEYQIHNTNTAEVKLKQPDTTPIPPKPAKAKPILPKVQKPPLKKTLPNKQINDLLKDIATSGSSKGAATGGSNLGSSDTSNMLANYADLVIARVRPFVIIPDGVDPSVKAIVEVTLLPNMQVYNVALIRSSGNNEYDNNVQQAINRVQIFPPLPSGANFTDFRKIKLTFKPQ